MFGDAILHDASDHCLALRLAFLLGLGDDLEPKLSKAASAASSLPLLGVAGE